MKTDFLASIWTYVCLQILKTWVSSLIYYVVWGFFVRENSSFSVNALFLVSPIFISILLTPLIAPYFDRCRPKTIRNILVSCNAASSLIGLLAIILIFDGASFTAIILVLLANSFLVSVDTLAHQPVIFMMARQSGAQLTRLRSFLMLATRGSNVVTPTLSLLISNIFWLIILFVLCSSVASLLSTLFIGIIRRDNNEQPDRKTEEKTSGGQTRSHLIRYSITTLVLNLIFAQTAVLFTSFHFLNEDSIAYLNAGFFAGFIMTSLLLLVKSNIFKAVYGRERLNFLLIGATTVCIAIAFYGIGVDLFSVRLISAIVAGIFYGFNVHLVTTVYASLIPDKNIFRDFNIARNLANVGALGASIFSAWLVLNLSRLETGLTMIATAALLFGFSVIGIAMRSASSPGMTLRAPQGPQDGV